MNERFRELAKQALDYAEKNQSADIPQHWFELHNKKFAQLIVAECALLCISRPGPGDDVRSREHCAELITKHFGVLDGVDKNIYSNIMSDDSIDPRK